MNEWWISLEPVMKVLWGVTLSASLIFVIQTVLTFIGADADFDTDFSADVDASGADGIGGGSNLYTFRNLVNFCLGFGWSDILLRDQIKSKTLVILISLAVGVALVAAVMYIFRTLSKMQESGNIDVFKSAVGCSGTAYLTVPAGRSGEGKVQITINNAVREYTALTDGDAISTGERITVVEVLDSNTLLVEKQNTLII